MATRIDQLNVVLTCFAYRSTYFAELEGMLATAREHHPHWPTVIGKGPVEGVDRPALEVDSPSGKDCWPLPVSLSLDGTNDDWRKITRLKGWWIAQVWRNFGRLAGADRNRLVWIDADSRFNGPLDIELDQEAEVIAGPWEYYPVGKDHIASGLLVFQGARGGAVEIVLNQWSAECLSQIEHLPPPTMPWGDGDQEVLTDLLKTNAGLETEYTLLKLEHDKYAFNVTVDGDRFAGAIVESWQMSRKMRLPVDRRQHWPPPEESRRRTAK